MASFPSVKARKLMAILERDPLNYCVVRQRGSHRLLEAPGRTRLIFAFHDGETLPPGLVRKILVRDAGLSEDEALGLL